MTFNLTTTHYKYCTLQGCSLLSSTGMKPVMFSVCEAMKGRGAWVRTGVDICYHKNHYSRIPKSHDNVRFKKSVNKCYYTATFTVTFPHAYDVCYLAYHYPYTYTQLQVCDR